MSLAEGHQEHIWQPNVIFKKKTLNCAALIIPFVFSRSRHIVKFNEFATFKGYRNVTDRTHFQITVLDFSEQADVLKSI